MALALLSPSRSVSKLIKSCFHMILSQCHLSQLQRKLPAKQGIDARMKDHVPLVQVLHTAILGVARSPYCLLMQFVLRTICLLVQLERTRRLTACSWSFTYSLVLFVRVSVYKYPFLTITRIDFFFFWRVVICSWCIARRVYGPSSLLSLFLVSF